MASLSPSCLHHSHSDLLSITAIDVHINIQLPLLALFKNGLVDDLSHLDAEHYSHLLKTSFIHFHLY